MDPEHKPRILEGETGQGRERVCLQAGHQQRRSQKPSSSHPTPREGGGFPSLAQLLLSSYRLPIKFLPRYPSCEQSTSLGFEEPWRVDVERRGGSPGGGGQGGCQKETVPGLPLSQGQLSTFGVRISQKPLLDLKSHSSRGWCHNEASLTHSPGHKGQGTARVPAGPARCSGVYLASLLAGALRKESCGQREGGQRGRQLGSSHASARAPSRGPRSSPSFCRISFLVCKMKGQI